MNRLKFRDKTNGFTFIEVILSVLIISLISISMSQWFSQILHSSNNIYNRTINSKNLIFIRNILKKELSQIKPPWWIGENNFTIEEENYTFNWHDGEENELLILQSDSTGISINIQKNDIIINKAYIPNIEILDIQLIVTENKNSIGYIFNILIDGVEKKIYLPKAVYPL